MIVPITEMVINSSTDLLRNLSKFPIRIVLKKLVEETATIEDTPDELQRFTVWLEEKDQYWLEPEILLK